jgi:hypothetical protein
MKYIILILLIYVAYRLFTGQPLLGSKKQEFLRNEEPDDPDYTDYEEID